MMKTVSSREYNKKASSIRKAATDGPVVITVRGIPESVLMSYRDYQKISETRHSIVDALYMPELAQLDDSELEIPKSTKTIRYAEFD